MPLSKKSVPHAFAFLCEQRQRLALTHNDVARAIGSKPETIEMIERRADINSDLLHGWAREVLFTVAWKHRRAITDERFIRIIAEGGELAGVHADDLPRLAADNDYETAALAFHGLRACLAALAGHLDDLTMDQCIAGIVTIGLWWLVSEARKTESKR